MLGMESKSQYVETFSGKPVEGRPHISTLDWGTSRFSAVLESGRRPELKSAEKREVPLVIVELFSIGVEIARRFRYHLLGFWVSVESPRGINKTFGSRPCHRSDELI